MDQATERLMVEEEVEEEKLELSLKYEAHHIIKIISPVTICMVFVVATISTIPFYTERGIYLLETPFHERTFDEETLAWQSFANAGIFVAIIAVFSAFMALTYKYREGCRTQGRGSCNPCCVTEIIAYRCTKLIHGFLFILSLIGLIYMDYQDLTAILNAYNLPLDYITTTILFWNFATMGLIAIHWKAPLIIQQAYEIFSCALIALTLIKFLPHWTTWTVLALMALWDLFSHFAPFSPLRIMIETAKKKKDKTPLYSSGFEEDGGVKCGLGNFIFYSVLVGTTSSYGDWNTTLACFVAILIGLCLTLVFLAYFRKALPALPISIFFGIVFYFVTSEIVTPFCDELTSRQIFI